MRRAAFLRFIPFDCGERSLAVEAFADNFARIRDKDECVWFRAADELAQLDGLRAFHNRKNNVFMMMRKGTRCITDRRAPVQLFGNEIADWLWV